MDVCLELSSSSKDHLFLESWRRDIDERGMRSRKAVSKAGTEIGSGYGPYGSAENSIFFLDQPHEPTAP